MKTKNKLILTGLLSLLLTLLCHDAYSQLNNFTLSVTPSPQTCLGNGSLNFTVSGTTPGSTMEFAVYLLPDITQPVTTVTTLSATGLVAGDYTVVATQTLGNQVNSNSANATIASSVIPLVYSTTVVSATCNKGGTVTVNVTSGTADTYEIIAGPEVFPQQESNVFTDLQAGQYQLRVYDACGDALVTTVQVVQQSPAITINPSGFTDVVTCNTVSMNYFFFATAQPNGVIAFPITITYKVYPPGGGAPTVITDVMPTGEIYNYINKEIPYYNGQYYTYDILITDACGNTYERLNLGINQTLNLQLSKFTQSCEGYFLQLYATNEVAPLTVEFTSAPAGFNPSDFNPLHPISNEAQVTYGNYDDPLPFGAYTVKITDACGNTATQSIILEETGEPSVYVNPGDECNNYVTIILPNFRAISSAVIVSAPEGYSPLPHDVTASASFSTLFIGLQLQGYYTFKITDECGREYTVNVHVVSDINPTVYIQQSSGCTTGRASVMLYVAQAKLVSVKITAAPPGFTMPLPADVSANINSGNLYINSLPAGNYTFQTIDNCGNPRTATYTINGYIPDPDPVDILYNCGSFNISMHHQNVMDLWQSFSLQKFDEGTGEWVNPSTGNPDIGIWLDNNMIHYNFSYQGKFRIVRTSFLFNGGPDPEPGTTTCNSVIYSFVFTGVPVINGAYAFPCGNNTSEVIIDAVGVPPLNYAITTKNGTPFVVNNGENFVFTGLENGSYNFKVTDDCGNITNIQYDISNLKPLPVMQAGFCAGGDSSLSVKLFSFLTYEWWKAGAPETILSATNSLDFPQFGPEDSGVYYVRIASTTPGSCIDIVLEHEVVVPSGVNAGEDALVINCDFASTINLADYLSPGHTEGGNWTDTDQTGQLNGTIFTTTGMQPGLYNFEYEVSGCGSQDTAIITIDIKAAGFFAPLLTAGCINAGYVVAVANIDEYPGATIAWTGPGGFSSSEAVAAITLPGTYTAVVTNTEGCVSEEAITVEKTSCDIPKGVSPNGDGMNDEFDLSDMFVSQLQIFNRYGFVVYEAGNYKKEWHGQTNKDNELPTGTYYYVITPVSGKRVSGWVYLQRQM